MPPHWEFPCSEPIDLRMHLTSGRVGVTAEPTEMITVDVRSTKPARHGDDYAEDVQVDYADGHLEITEPPPQSWLHFGRSLDIAITLPAGSRCSVSTTSADITCKGELGSLDAKTISGKLTSGPVAGDLELTTTSGNATVGDVTGAVTVKSASGNVELGRVGGDASVNTVSGRVRIGTAAASATVRTASGRVAIESLARGRAEIATVSGNIEVDVAAGVGVYLDLSSLSGKVSSDLEPSENRNDVALELRCRSVSGSLRVGRAALADVAG
jgi:hypothetical protein